MKGEKTVLDVTIREARKNKEGVHFTTEHLILELFCEEIERIGGAAAGMIETIVWPDLFILAGRHQSEKLEEAKELIGRASCVIREAIEEVVLARKDIEDGIEASMRGPTGTAG